MYGHPPFASDFAIGSVNQQPRFPSQDHRPAQAEDRRILVVIDRFQKEPVRHDSTFDTSCFSAGCQQPSWNENIERRFDLAIIWVLPQSLWLPRVI